MKVQVINKTGKVIVDFLSAESINFATNQAIEFARQEDNFFAVYVDGKLNCYSESSDFFEFPETIKETI